MKNINLIIGGFLLSILSCTHKTDNCIAENAQNNVQSSLVFTQGDSCYFSDLKLTDDYCVIADSKNERHLQVYRKENYTLSNTADQDQKSVYPVAFTKEVIEGKDENELFFISSTQSLNKLSLDENSLKNQVVRTNLPFPVSVFYNNLPSGAIYASPIFSSKMHAFSYYKTGSGINRIQVSPKIKNIFPGATLIGTNSLCVNEKLNTTVTAYRFCNFVSFYDLTGNLKNTVQIGEEICKPVINRNTEIDVESTTKYFIDICGTPQYIYCLYNGDKDFSINSKVFIFDWNGKHIKAWQLDRAIRKFAVDKSDKYIIAISTNSTGGQDVIRYNLEN